MGLHQFLENIKYDLNEISISINKLYFSQWYWIQDEILFTPYYPIQLF
jgi:hypothetical protein